MWQIPPPQDGAVPVLGPIAAQPPLWAASQYGILGQTAPELNLSYWIDGNGNPMAPVRLADYRGKVVYLYFFQDW